MTVLPPVIVMIGKNGTEFVQLVVHVAIDGATVFGWMEHVIAANADSASIMTEVLDLN